jgi:DNA topoisomerase-2
MNNGFNGSQNGSATTPAHQDYVQLTNEELIYKKNEMYIGSMVPEHIEQLHFDWNTGRLDARMSWYIQALVNVYLEILLNASDNVYKSRLAGIDPGIIEVNLSSNTVSIKNYGLAIPIEKNHLGVWKPEFIFSYTNTSSTYDDHVGTAGRFGQGAKITNIYSLMFGIVVVNNGYKYTQYWRNNKTIRNEPEIVQTSEPNSTTVIWTLDFQRFGITEYTIDMLQVMAHEAILVSMSGKIPITINGISYDYSKLPSYADLVSITPEKLHYMVEQPQGYIEFCLIATAGYTRIISVCNGIHTSSNGKYVTTVKNALFTELVAKLNAKFDTRPKEERTRALVSMSSLDNEFSLIVNYWSRDAKFSGQFKSEQSSPSPELKIPPSLLKRIEDWSLAKRLVHNMNAVLNRIISKTDGKKKRNKYEGKATSADEAGGRNSRKCSLFVVEGESAAGYLETMVGLIPGGRSFIGVLPFRGKFINAMKASILDLASNEEYKEFKQEMGLSEGTDYNDPSNHKSLRYGRIVIMGDADDDGEHFKGLVLTMIAAKFPGLITTAVVWTRRTPQLRVTHLGKTYDFFSISEYEKWKAETGVKTKPVFFKGLGSSNAEQIAHDLQIMRDLIFEADQNAWHYLSLAFGKGKTEERKGWLIRTPVFEPVLLDKLEISVFINSMVIAYSRASIRRAIPDYRDQLKLSIRQVMWGCLQHFDYGTSAKYITVANLSSEISIKVNYHHANKSLEDAIKLMAADYVGSGNNAPELVPNGVFGTRKELGDDAAASRYVKTCLQPWVKYLYRKEDEKLLTRRVVEESVVEPEFLLPVIPRIYNSTKGMGTGWSTTIPNYRPSDIIYWYKARLTGNILPPMIPWYRGYKGRVIPQENNVLIEGIVSLLNETQNSYLVMVSEIPIITSVRDYREKLLRRLEDEGVINVKKDVSAGNSIHFELEVAKFMQAADETGKPITKPTISTNSDIYDLLELRKTVPTSNMTFIGNGSIPVIYRDITHYMENYYDFRLPFYTKRKEVMLADKLEKIKEHQQRILLTQILASYPGNIVKFKKEQMHQLLRSHGIPIELLNKKILSLSEDNIEKILQKIETLKQEYELLSVKTSEQLWIDDLLELEKHIPL